MRGAGHPAVYPCGHGFDRADDTMFFGRLFTFPIVLDAVAFLASSERASAREAAERAAMETLNVGVF
ncbi:hypothetical protein [Nitratireductor aquibiodomus]|nr:hypothetical protein [Nitratireductor aquibiodomus]